MFPILWARQRRTEMFGYTRGRVTRRPLPLSAQIISRTRPVMPHRWREVGMCSHSTAFSAWAGWKSMIPLRPSGRRSGADRDGTPEGSGAGRAHRHHAIGLDGLAAVGERAAVEGGDGGV